MGRELFGVCAGVGTKVVEKKIEGSAKGDNGRGHANVDTGAVVHAIVKVDKMECEYFEFGNYSHNDIVDCEYLIDLLKTG